MATISTSANFDAAVRTAGETFTIDSGATLTIRTDTRYHKNAPAAGVGSIGSFTMTAATGGTCLIDGRNVWLIPYDGGTGNVPTLGSTVTGATSGATGELMNVSSSVSTAPTTSGSAMPVTGFVKLTTKSGTFQDNENLQVSGVTFAVVNSTTGGKTGFIEIVMDDGAGFTIGRAQKFQVRGDWYYSDTTTSGSRHQQIQLPNYGGANCFYPGVWIETGVSTNTYEFWPAALAGTGSPWATANLGSDARSKFVQCLASGIIRIGGDGTNSIGDLPVSGCRIRIPNVIVKSCATGTRASDSVPSGTITTRPDFTVTNAGQIDVEFLIGHWQMNFGQAYSVKLHHVALFDRFTITETATALDLWDGGNGNYTIAQDAAAMVLTSNFAGGTIVEWKAGRAGTIASADYGWNVTYCNNLYFSGCHFQNRTFRTNAGGHPFYAAYCSGLVFSYCVVVGCSIYLLTCTDTTLTNTYYADSYNTTSSATTPPVGAIQLVNRTLNTTVNGFGWYTSVANVHPDTAILYLSAAYNVKARNIGTYSSPLSAGSSNAMLYFCNDAGNSQNIEFKRVYFNLIATTFFNAVNSTKGVKIINCKGNTTSTKNLVSAALNQEIYNSDIASIAPASTASIYGSIFYHHWTSSTAGRLGLVFSEPTSEFSSYVTTSFTTTSTGTSGFNSSNGLALVNSGDYAIFEFPITIVGIDSFQNSAPTVTTSTNMTIEYQIDTGSGWNGTWKTFNAANLSGETVDEVSGFKFKIRCTANATSASNILTALYCLTNSNSTAQQIVYPLDTYTLTLTGLSSGSDVSILRASTSIRLLEVQEQAGTTCQYTYAITDTNITNSTSDGFSRADSSSLGADWTDIQNGFSIASFKAAPENSGRNISMHNLTAPANVFARASFDTIETNGKAGLRVRWNNASGNGYGATANFDTGGHTVTVYRTDSSVDTTLGTISQSFASGNWLGLMTYGNTIRVMYSTNGVDWAEIGAFTDATYNTDGNVCIVAHGTGSRLDNFIFNPTIENKVDICVFKAGYTPFYIRNYSLSSASASIPVAQVADRAYLT